MLLSELFMDSALPLELFKFQSTESNVRVVTLALHVPPLLLCSLADSAFALVFTGRFRRCSCVHWPVPFILGSGNVTAISVVPLFEEVCTGIIRVG